MGSSCSQEAFKHFEKIWKFSIQIEPLAVVAHKKPKKGWIAYVHKLVYVIPKWINLRLESILFDIAS